MKSYPRVVLGVLAVVLMLLLLTSCSDLFNTDEEDETTHVLVNAENGGNVPSPDGLFNLTIPPNALDEDTYVDIGIVGPSEYPDDVAGLGLVGKAYSLEPDGLELSSPATLEIEMTEGELGSDVETGEYSVISGILRSSDGTMEPVDSSTVRYNSKDDIVFTGRISHFSSIFRSTQITSYEPLKSHGTAHVVAHMGPEVLHVGYEYFVYLSCTNHTDLELFVDAKNFGSSPVEWSSVYTSFGVRAGATTGAMIDPGWSCEDIGKGRVAVAVYLTPLDSEIQSAAHGVWTPQQVECVAEAAQATNCGDDNLKYLMKGFWFNFFRKEPCSDVKEPEGDGTIKNSWGLIKDVSPTMVGTYRWGTQKQYITQEEWWNIEEVYPFGPDNFWIGTPGNLRADHSSSMGSIEKYAVFFNVMHDTVPHADPANHFQYGFVFDRDGDTENNYEPHPSYPYDFFQDTDYWITASYNPVAGWTFQASDATDSVITSVSTGARMLIIGNTLVLLVPRSEFMADYIGYRMSAYRHPGDWGVGGDWDGDVQPPVADGLKWVDIGSDYTQ